MFCCLCRCDRVCLLILWLNLAGSVQEFCTFASKTIVERTSTATRQSVKQDVYMCHVYVRADNLAAVLIADHEYPGEFTFCFMQINANEFDFQDVSHTLWSQGFLTNFHQKFLVINGLEEPNRRSALHSFQLMSASIKTHAKQIH